MSVDKKRANQEGSRGIIKSAEEDTITFGQTPQNEAPYVIKGKGKKKSRGHY